MVLKQGKEMVATPNSHLSTGNESFDLFSVEKIVRQVLEVTHQVEELFVICITSKVHEQGPPKGLDSNTVQV